MIVISDTTPLISFLKINRLDLLEKLYLAGDLAQKGCSARRSDAWDGAKNMLDLIDRNCGAK